MCEEEMKSPLLVSKYVLSTIPYRPDRQVSYYFGTTSLVVATYIKREWSVVVEFRPNGLRIVNDIGDNYEELWYGDASVDMYRYYIMDELEKLYKRKES